MPEFYNAFISYGRADSKEFATKLYHSLFDAGFNIWFDQNDIPLAVDFQEQINDGIAKADNFIFIIAPHAVNSPYCLKEIKLALKYNKRIIPLLHVEQISYETWQARNPQGTESQWQDYQAKGLHSSFPNMHPEIGKINWVYFLEQTNNFDESLANLIELFHKHENYVRQHTEILEKALEWEQNKKQSRYLLVGEERQAAEDWLEIRFNDEQAPCQPSDLHCEFICESIKNANNLLTQVFLSYSETSREMMQQLSKTLQREKITIWTNKTDIKTGTDFQEEIKRGIADADNLVYLVSPESLQSEYCQQEIQLALDYHKRIICLIVEPTPLSTIPVFLRSLQFLDLTDWQNEASYRRQTDELIKQVKQDESYYEQHKILLVKALKWQEQNHNPSILLRGYNLQHFQAWHKVASSRQQHPPIAIQTEFLSASSHQSVTSSLEVFISYSRTDSDLARKINDALQFQGKNTWFDQESIAAGTDFQQEIYRGIENSDNFLFIISPKSVSSPYCGDEVEYAQKLNKRFVTILYRPVEAKTLHPALAKVQWIDFNQHQGDFYANFSELVRTLDTDRDHVRSHTKWSQRSLEWQEKDKSPDLLLRGSELNVAESWLRESVAENKQPPATDLQKEFIAKSQGEREAGFKQEKRRILILRSLLCGVSVALISAIALGLKASKLATEATIKADAIVAQNLINANPVEALTNAIAIAGRSEAKLGQVLPIAQSSLSEAVYAIRERHRFKGHHSTVHSVAITPDGQKIVSGSEDNTIRVWNLNGEELAILTGHQNYISAVAITPDGQTIVSGSGDNTIRVWNFNGEELAVLTGHQNRIASVTITPDGQKIVSGSWDGTIRVWDLNSGAELAVLTGHESGIISLAITPDGEKIVSGSWDKTIRVWDLNSGEQLAVLTGHDLGVISVTVSPDGEKIVSGSWDGTIRIWDLNSGAELEVLKGHQDRVWSVKITPDGQKIVSGSGDKTIRVWDISGDELAIYKGHESGVISVAITPDGETIVSGSDDKTIRLWDMSGQESVRLTGHEQATISVAVSPDGKQIVSGSADKTIRVWDISGKQLAVLTGHENTVNSVAITPDGQQIVSGSDDATIRLWNISGKELAGLTGHQGGVISVAVTPDGEKIVSGSLDSTIRVWDISGEELAVLGGHGGEVISVAISPDGKTIVSGSADGAIRLWNISGEQLAMFKGHESGVYSVAITPDGKKIVSSGLDNKIRIWNLLGQPLAVLPGHENYVRLVAITPDGQTIVSASQDNTIRVWDLNSGQELGILKGHEGGVNSVAITPDGETIVSGSDDKTIRLWGSSFESWLAAGCDRMRSHPVFVETALVKPEKTSIWLSENVGKIGQRLPQNLETGNIEVEAVKTCAQQAWNNRQKAEFYVQQGLLVARLTTDFELAQDKFTQAQKLDREFYASLADDPEIKAKETIAVTLVKQAVGAIGQNDLELAWKNLVRATELDAELEQVDKWDLNSLCWDGSVRGYAAQVLAACEMAVKRDPDNGAIRDSRGVARVLTGNYPGAIADFEAFINWTDNQQQKVQRQDWVTALRQDRNPLTEKVIQELRGVE